MASCNKNLDFITKEDLQELQRIIQDDQGKRVQVLNNLMTFSKDVIDVNFLTTFSLLFLIDERCLCKGLIEKRRNLFLLDDLVVNDNINLNSKFMLTETSRAHPRGYLSLQIMPFDDSMDFLPSNRFNSWNSNKGRVLLCVSSDAYINEVIINLILDQILGGKGHVYQYFVFFCGDKGYTVLESSNQGTLQEFITSNSYMGMLEDILVQVMTPLSILKSDRYGFNHGALTTESVVVDTERGTKYKITNFEKSGIYWNGIRFYRGATYRPKDMFPLSDGYYTIEQDVDIPTEIYTVNNPQGFYSSYDIYTFIYSLFLEPNVWKVVYEQFYTGMPTLFLKVWKSLWTPEDLQVLMADLQSQHAILNLNKVGSQEYNIQLNLMRNIHVINKTFASKGYKLLKNINHVYELLGIPLVESTGSITDDRTLIITKNNKLAIEPTIVKHSSMGDWMYTNIYSKMRMIYTWDYI